MCGMDTDRPTYRVRSIDEALADLRNSHDRAPDTSLRIRAELARMIDDLEAEIALRQARGQRPAA
jgi:hypothetical protein